MSAFFRNTTQEGLDKNARGPAPVTVLPSSADAAAWAAMTARFEADKVDLAKAKKQLEPEFEKWEKTATPEQLGSWIEGNVLSLRMDEGATQELHGIARGARWTIQGSQAVNR